MAELMKMTPADPFTLETMRELAQHRENCITIYMPTARAGAETTVGARRLKSLLDQVERDLIDEGMSKGDREKLLAPAQQLITDSPFWQEQADGLGIFLAPDFFKTVRFSRELPLEVHYGNQFVLRPVLPIIASGNSVYVFAFGQQSVRFFEADRDTITQLDLGSIPAEMSEVAGTDPRESQLQHQHTDQTAYHGHGVGKEIDQLLNEKYVRRLAEGVDKELNNRPDKPLVLATVQENAATFRRFSKYKNIYPEIINGNPRRRNLEQIHRNTGEVVGDLNKANRDKAADHFRTLLGTGKASTDLDEIRQAVFEGRLERLLVDSERSLSNGGAELDPIIADALTSSAEVISVSDLGDDILAGAVFRY